MAATEKKVWIGGQPWTVKMVKKIDPDGTDAEGRPNATIHGLCEIRDKRISIRTGNPASDTLEFHMHECLHAVAHEHSANDVFSAMQNEDVVRVLAKEVAGYLMQVGLVNTKGA